MSLFWTDTRRAVVISYDTFYVELIAAGTNNQYVQHENPYLVFLHLLRNLLCGRRSVLLDADFSEKELLDLGITNERITGSEYYQDDLSATFKSLDEIFLFFINEQDKLEIEIFTSGTTGKPKNVIQPLKNVIRAVKTSVEFKQHIWGFAYNPTHFAGLQVFFQAFFNKSPLVYIFDNDYGVVYKSLLQNTVSHLSCTPTFMKMLLPYIEAPLNSMQSLTFGGEKFDGRIAESIRHKFPNAVIKNVYASTEAGSLLRTDGEYFVIPGKYEKLIKVENNELFINRQLLGTSNLFELEGEWYKTGDQVEFVDEKRFRFFSRKSEMINVGGYKVNPAEIEGLIMQIEGVKDVMVFGRENSVMGNIIETRIIKEITEEDSQLKDRIKSILKANLQEYKMPRIIKFVTAFETTRTGKVKKS